MQEHYPRGHHHNTSGQKGKIFAIGIALNVAFVVIEIIYGLVANSTALLADAGHNASDVLSLVLAWSAMWLAGLKPKGKYTYGWRKTTILVSIVNALLLFGAVYFIGREAFIKFYNPEQVAGKQVMVVAGIGVVINTITGLLIIKGQKEDLNVRGAFLHMTADAAVSLGVLISGLLIYLTGKLWIDPMMSIIVIIVIVMGTWRLLKDSVDLALDAVPKNIDLKRVKTFMLSEEGVEDVHDLHIWSMSTTEIALTAHVIRPKGHEDAFILKLQKNLKQKFDIDHTTIQIEKTGLQDDCK